MIVREVVVPANERVTIPLGYVPQWVMVTINSGVVDFVFGTETETPPITLNAVQTIKLRNFPVRDKCTFIEKVGLEARCYLFLLDAENEADQTGVAVNPLTKTPEGGLIIAGDVTITGKLRVNQSTQLDTTLFLPLKVNVGASGVLESYAGVDVYSSASTTGVPLLRLRTEGARTVVASTRTGAGSYLPLAFDTGGAERLRIGTDGTLSFSTQTGRINLDNSGYRWIETKADGAGGFHIRVANSSTSNTSPFWELYDSAAAAPRIRLYLGGDPGSSTEHLRLWPDGLRFRQATGDEANAGMIAHRRFTSGLDIVGAGGEGSRVVSLWDRLVFPYPAAPQISMPAGGIIHIPNGVGGIGNYQSNLPLKLESGLVFAADPTYGTVVLTAYSGGANPMISFRAAENPSTVWLAVYSDNRVVIPQTTSRLDAYGILRDCAWGWADNEIILAGGTEQANVGPAVSVNLATATRLMVVATGVVRSTSSANTNAVVWVTINGTRYRAKRIWCSGANDNHSFALSYLLVAAAGTYTINLDFRADTPGWNTAIGSREILVFAMNTQT